MTPQDIEIHKANIDRLGQMEMAGLQRFAPSGHPYFTLGTELPKYFQDRFKKMGGMTPAISKLVGWQQ